MRTAGYQVPSPGREEQTFIMLLCKGSQLTMRLRRQFKESLALFARSNVVRERAFFDTRMGLELKIPVVYTKTQKIIIQIISLVMMSSERKRMNL